MNFVVYYLLMTALMVSKTDLSNVDNNKSIVGSVVPLNWACVADSMQVSFYEGYKSRDNAYFIENNRGKRTFHYWWNAHAVDVFLDGYERTGAPTYLQKAKNLVQGIKDTNGGTYSIVFYDDMLWLALASLRAFEVSGDPFFMDAVEYLWQDILTGLNDNEGGGVAWRKDQLAYKNTPANAPAVILACRLYRHLGRAEDLALAEELFQWLRTTLVDHETGVIWDGKNRLGDGKIDKNWMFTYNQGVYFGAAHELYLMTGQQSYLDVAVTAAHAAINHHLIAPGGVLRDEGQGDGGLFKGIMVRYLALLAVEPAVDWVDRKRFGDFIRFNAETAYRNALARPTMLIGHDWHVAPPKHVDMSTQLSGIMLFEAAARLN